ncbi:M14 family zinc carboxypeptidase [Knoellia locipacati]|uniref:Peptidase M14 n=1 Tax=Knoellia locipacati TaxID=882824 RepID=A0A512T3J4_9MICO|nr:M14 family zinc carboxypeptidase [Knoellia locipacati]GEQ14788.1 peptidase M14 [Knoellia locipacati]
MRITRVGPGVVSAVALVAAGLAGAGVAAAAPQPNAQDDKVQIVTVHAATQKERSAVDALGLDTTEHADEHGVDVVLHGAGDVARLRAAGKKWTVKVADLAAVERANAKKDKAYAASVASSQLPSGRTSYRTLADYNAEMAALARKYPTKVKPLTLANPSVLGKPINGIEITDGAANTADGKPVFLMMGAHHAREWPSSEHSMEFAYDLLESGDARNAAILKGVRTIVVPVVNVDGFQISRSAAPLGDFSTFDYEMKRKNCSISTKTPAQYTTGTCDNNLAGRLRGTDPNRNYPGFWGGPGASFTWSSDTYRGDGPGSEPEVDAVRKLISSRQVTALITNHTYSNLVLRPPSLASTGFSPDEIQYRALGADFASHNGYSNIPSFGLYDTSGSVEDWSYWNTGGYGFTFEIGTEGFHPPYETGVVAEYAGLAPAAGAGKGGNREAYYRAAAAAMDKGMHSTITGKAPANTTLTVRKTYQGMTSPVLQPGGTTSPPIPYTDVLSSSLAGKGGSFSWAVNPSTRPLVVGRYGRDPVAPTAPSQTIANPAGVPAVGASEFSNVTIQGLPTYDNGKVVFNFSWPGGTAVDWDFYIYDAAGNQVASAATADNPETATALDPVPGGYRIEANNYDGGSTSTDWSGTMSFLPPDPAIVTGVKEAWNLTCTSTKGKVLSTRSVIVDRGQSVDVGNPCNRGKNPR